MGYSVGHWDGDTLVWKATDTTTGRGWTVPAIPHSESLRVTERYQRTDLGHVELQVTFDDPMVFTRPVTVPIHMELCHGHGDDRVFLRRKRKRWLSSVRQRGPCRREDSGGNH